MTVEVHIINQGAIYVDNHRITNRSTKWGVMVVQETFNCLKKDVVMECFKRGYHHHIKNIDDPDYPPLKD